jgi:hypothetical protein
MITAVETGSNNEESLRISLIMNMSLSLDRTTSDDCSEDPTN